MRPAHDPALRTTPGTPHRVAGRLAAAGAAGAAGQAPPPSAWRLGPPSANRAPAPTSDPPAPPTSRNKGTRSCRTGSAITQRSRQRRPRPLAERRPGGGLECWSYCGVDGQAPAGRPPPCLPIDRTRLRHAVGGRGGAGAQIERGMGSREAWMWAGSGVSDCRGGVGPPAAGGEGGGRQAPRPFAGGRPPGARAAVGAGRSISGGPGTGRAVAMADSGSGRGPRRNTTRAAVGQRRRPGWVCVARGGGAG
jgi:hypothetical protein